MGMAKRRGAYDKRVTKNREEKRGHSGSTRSLVQTPDEVIILRPEKCARCQTNLQGVKAQGCERRQRIDLPEIKAQVTEYQAQDVACPHCQHVTRGPFPDDIRASVQFGPMIKGIALYLLSGQ